MDKRRRVIFGGSGRDALVCLRKWGLAPKEAKAWPTAGAKTPAGGGAVSSSAQESPAHLWSVCHWLSQTLHSINMGAWESCLWPLPAGLQGRDLPLSFPGQRHLLLMADLPLNAPGLPCRWLPLSSDTSPGSLPRAGRFFLGDFLWKWPSQTSSTPGSCAPPHIQITQGKNGCNKAQSTQTSHETRF